MSEHPEEEGIFIDPLGSIQGANVDNLNNSSVVTLSKFLVQLKKWGLWKQQILPINL